MKHRTVFMGRVEGFITLPKMAVEAPSGDAPSARLKSLVGNRLLVPRQERSKLESCLVTSGRARGGSRFILVAYKH